MRTESSRPILTISLLTSNRPETVRKCLESLTPLRQAIPCELLITDTSKAPEIRKIIEVYADRIFEFEWCNDFSKARNVGLSEARGEWFMYMDDDEWFDDLSEMIAFFRSGEYRNYGYANYKTRDYIDVGLNYYSDTWASRMIRIDPDTHFKSKIHEHFEPVRGKLKSLNCHTHHVGYIYKSREDLMKHFYRNESLLREMMEEEPNNLRWQIQLVQEYRNIKDWNKVCDFCENQLKANSYVNNKYDNIHLGTLYAGYAEASIFQKEYIKCVEICGRGLADQRSTDVTKAYLHLKLMESYFGLRDIENTRKYLEIYFKESEELPKHKETWVEQNTALLVNEVFDETNIKKAYSILIGCDLLEGSTQMLHEHYDKLEWKRDVIYVYDNIEKVFLEAMAKLSYEPIFAEVMTDIFHNTELKKLLLDEANRLEDENSNVFANFKQAGWRYKYFKVAMAEQRVVVGLMRFSDINIYMDALRCYVDRVLDFYAGYYVEEAFFQFPEVLPQNVQAAIKMMEFEELVGQHGEQALYLLEEAAMIYPLFSDAMNKLMEYYSEVELKNREEIHNMHQLMEQSDVSSFDLARWMEYVDAKQTDGIMELEGLRASVNEVFSSNDLRYLYFMKCYGNQLIRLESTTESFEQLYKRFFDFMEYTLGYYLCIFKDVAFQGEMEMLPVDVKAAVILHRMFSREENDWVNKVRDLRECACVYPVLGKNIKCLAGMIQ